MYQHFSDSIVLFLNTYIKQNKLDGEVRAVDNHTIYFTLANNIEGEFTDQSYHTNEYECKIDTSLSPCSKYIDKTQDIVSVKSELKDFLDTICSIPQ
jgi:hypothetical protein